MLSVLSVTMLCCYCTPASATVISTYPTIPLSHYSLTTISLPSSIHSLHLPTYYPLIPLSIHILFLIHIHYPHPYPLLYIPIPALSMLYPIAMCSTTHYPIHYHHKPLQYPQCSQKDALTLTPMHILATQPTTFLLFLHSCLPSNTSLRPRRVQNNQLLKYQNTNRTHYIRMQKPCPAIPLPYRLSLPFSFPATILGRDICLYSELLLLCMRYVYFLHQTTPYVCTRSTHTYATLQPSKSNHPPSNPSKPLSIRSNYLIIQSIPFPSYPSAVLYCTPTLQYTRTVHNSIRTPPFLLPTNYVPSFPGFPPCLSLPSFLVSIYSTSNLDLAHSLLTLEHLLTTQISQFTQFPNS